jgi:hypothetical protein
MVSFNYSQTSKRSLWSRFGGIIRKLHPNFLPHPGCQPGYRQRWFLFASMMSLAL